MNKIRTNLTRITQSPGTMLEKFNQQTVNVLLNNSKLIPNWITPNHVTYFRGSLVFPTMFLLANGKTGLAAATLLGSSLLDYVDGTLYRYRKQKRIEIFKLLNPNHVQASGEIPEKEVKSKEEIYGGFLDASVDKVFAFPVWLWLFYDSSDLAVEGYSLHIRTKDFAIQESGVDSAAKTDADVVGKVKHALSMSGTFLLVADATGSLGVQPFGFGLMCFALPLSMASVYKKVKVRNA
eukprot:maker-scaffold_6-snap-gene-13.3-mRNA-1 protein AED:0.31 eAED:0.31 QI:44/1/1/1/0/0/2/57/236